MKLDIYTTKEYRKSLKKFPKNLLTKLDTKIELFKQAPFHPTLKTHKLYGELKNYYSFSVNYEYRIIFKFINEKEVVFMNIGTHKIYQ